MKIAGLLIMFFAVCTACYAFPMDSTVVCEPNADGAGNSLWIMSHTQLEAPYLDGTPDSYLPWGKSTDEFLVGDVQGDGFDDVVFVHEGESSGWCEWAAAHTADSNGGVGVLSSTKFSGANCGEWYNKAALFLKDVNGDGRKDIVYVGLFGTFPGTFGWFAGHSDANGVSFATGSFAAFGGPYYHCFFPLMGDFNGDKRADMCVIYQLQPTDDYLWIVGPSNAGGLWQSANYIYSPFGIAGDIPLVGDIDGDGRDDRIVIRDGGNGNASWIVAYSDPNGQIDSTRPYGYGAVGLVTDELLLADINGDGKKDIGIFRDGYWAFGFTSETGAPAITFDVQQVYGQAGDIPLVGQFDILAADLNNDKCVTFKDFALLAGSWLQTGTGLPGDLDFNNTVDFTDLRYFVNQWLLCSH